MIRRYSSRGVSDAIEHNGGSKLKHAMEKTRSRKRQSGSHSSGATLPEGEEGCKLFKECLNIEEQNCTFYERTRFPLKKSREVLLGLLLRAWLITERGQTLLPGFSDLRLYLDQTGYDAELVGTSTGKVEFKSSAQASVKSKSFEFIFHPDFDFADHKLIVLLELCAGRPKRVHIAHGPRVMRAMKCMLLRDQYRNTYNPSSRPSLRIFSEDRPINLSTGRGHRARIAWGLETLAEAIWRSKRNARTKWSEFDWVHTIQNEELTVLLNQLLCNTRTSSLRHRPF